MSKQTVSILGGGHQGLAMAAHLSANGVVCHLWNRTLANIEVIINKRTITCTGIINGEIPLAGATDSISSNLSKLIMVTTPAFAHEDIAARLAPLVDSNHTIVLNPGRTLGALYFAYYLRKHHCKSMPLIAETQTILYTCRRTGDNSVHIYALKNDIPLATIDGQSPESVITILPSCMKGFFRPAKSWIQSSLGNVGMVLHPVPTLLNTGWIENSKSKFEYYYDGITSSIAKFLEKIDHERISVAQAMGHPNLESLSEWLRRTYRTFGSSLHEHLQHNDFYRGINAPDTLAHRYIEEDVPFGLVPLESIAIFHGIHVPRTSLAIDLANELMNKDYRNIGRLFPLPQC